MVTPIAATPPRQQHVQEAICRTALDAACEQACGAIAPSWPLDRSIAVNPHWRRIHRTVRQVAARMAVLGDIGVFPSRDWFRQAWQTGRIRASDLADARMRVAGIPQTWSSPNACVRALEQPLRLPRLPLLVDVLDEEPQHHGRLPWCQAATHQIGQTCAAYFDDSQSDWRPEPGMGLYAFWRETLVHDRSIGVLMGLPRLQHSLAALPATREEAERWALGRLGLPDTTWADYLEAELLAVNGWASWCAYLAWQGGLEGRHEPHLRELLAVRLAWGAILLECRHDDDARQALARLRSDWRQAATRLARAETALLPDEFWQVALEAGFQRDLSRRLQCAPGFAPAPADVELQAAFCIDVRSEPLRRALEAVAPSVQTLGVAGFFGVPAAYTPLGTRATRPQLPGLLAPAVEIRDRIDPAKASSRDDDVAAERARQRRFAGATAWDAASRWPGSAFSFVEAFGLGYLGKLGHLLRPVRGARSGEDGIGLSRRHRRICRPQIAGLDADAKVDLAARVLQAMGLVRDLAPLVLLVGHGSQSANNAHAAALDCGACCGQTGEVNARALARLLNDPEVRMGLLARGIAVPARTRFVAALHNTTTDEIEGFDLDLLPSGARTEWERWQAVFAQACDQVRRERAPKLGLDPRMPRDALLSALRRRASDSAQTRPEWGLAGNAAFIIAPRHRTRGVALDGRCFLHDYDAAQDADGHLLESLMTAPMLVTHWINWQYHASTCDPHRLGSGNKVLHNVVGGHIGVFEGNGGDLRIGLSRQSLHDGERWMHEPLRLTVVVDAPECAIARVIDRHEVVRQLIDHGWLHLCRFEGGQLLRYGTGNWLAIEP